MNQNSLAISSLVVALAVCAPHALSDERRAPAPKFSAEQTRGIFFDKLDDAFRGERPTIMSLRKSAESGATSPATSGQSTAQPSADKWSALISPTSIEDEIKRIRLHYDSLITSLGAFKSGGYQDAQVDLTVLASLFAVIVEYGGDVRWKDQAVAARDLIARTAFNCTEGSTQVYNEAKLRKADLQDLISGSGFAARDAEPANDWSMIADRSPLMVYGESLIEALEDATSDPATIDRQIELITRNAELLAVMGEILLQEGMGEADDEDYANLSRQMTAAAKSLRNAIESNNVKDIGKGPALIRQRCDACHNEYR